MKNRHSFDSLSNKNLGKTNEGEYLHAHLHLSSRLMLSSEFIYLRHI